MRRVQTVEELWRVFDFSMARSVGAVAISGGNEDPISFRLISDVTTALGVRPDVLWTNTSPARSRRHGGRRASEPKLHQS